MEKTRESLFKIIAKHSGQTYERVAADAERDNIMNPEEAKKYGLIDEILMQREKKRKIIILSNSTLNQSSINGF